MKVKYDDGVKFIINTLNKNGFEAYLVGGAVRNSLLDNFEINSEAFRTSNENHYNMKKVIDEYDFDITTSAKPSDVQNLFSKTIPTGLKHGTVTVLYNNKPYEVTTFRSEDDYSDGRHPDNVSFVTDLSSDLKRRDFTVNAMAYDINKDEVIDLFSSKKDLTMRLIRTVGNPDERFNEDALRLLRAIRFASQYNFNIEANTFISISKNAHLIKKVSVERIYTELSKILLSKKPSIGIRLLLNSSLLSYILPELLPMASFNQFSKYHDKDVFEHTLSVLDHVPNNLVMRLTALFHDSGKPYTYFMDEKGFGHFYGHEEVSTKIAFEALNRLKVDKKTINAVTLLISKHMVPLGIKKRVKIKKLINELGKENIDNFFDFKLADYGGKIDDVDESYYNLKNKVREIIDLKEPLTVKDLAINGEDLKNIGFKNGPLIGETLNRLLEIVLTDPSKNTKESLLELIKEMKDAK